MQYYAMYFWNKITSIRNLHVSLKGNIGGALASAAQSGGRILSNSKSVGYSLGASAAQAAKSGAKVAGEAVKGFNDEMDRTAKSPLLVSHFLCIWYTFCKY